MVQLDQVCDLHNLLNFFSEIVQIRDQLLSVLCPYWSPLEGPLENLILTSENKPDFTHCVSSIRQLLYQPPINKDYDARIEHVSQLIADMSSTPETQKVWIPCFVCIRMHLERDIDFCNDKKAAYNSLANILKIAWSTEYAQVLYSELYGVLAAPHYMDTLIEFLSNTWLCQQVIHNHRTFMLIINQSSTILMESQEKTTLQSEIWLLILALAIFAKHKKSHPTTANDEDRQSHITTHLIWDKLLGLLSDKFTVQDLIQYLQPIIMCAFLL